MQCKGTFRLSEKQSTIFPPELTAQYPNIAWPQIRGFRNILVHEYFGVDTEIVKDVIATHLSLLSEALEDALRRLES